MEKGNAGQISQTNFGRLVRDTDGRRTSQYGTTIIGRRFLCFIVAYAIFPLFLEDEMRVKV